MFHNSLIIIVIAMSIFKKIKEKMVISYTETYLCRSNEVNCYIVKWILIITSFYIFDLIVWKSSSALRLTETFLWRVLISYELFGCATPLWASVAAATNLYYCWRWVLLWIKWGHPRIMWGHRMHLARKIFKPFKLN